MVSVHRRVILCRDPHDNYLLETCAAGHADVLVTGDKDLLVLKSFEATVIVTPKQFVDELIPVSARVE